MGHTGWPVSRFSTYRNACLLGCATTGDSLAVDRDIREDRRRGVVMVPNAVMDELVMPACAVQFRDLTRPDFPRRGYCRDAVLRRNHRLAPPRRHRPPRPPRRWRTLPKRLYCRCRTRNRSATYSIPNSPGLGTVWKIHLRFPVRTSYPRTYPLTFVLLVGTPPGLWAAPTTMVFLPIAGVEWMPISLLSGSIS